MSAALAPNLFSRPTAEDWLVSRLRALGHPLEPDPTAALKDRLRRLIASHGIGCVIAGRAPGGGAEMLEDAWTRIYGEPFTPKASRGTKRKSSLPPNRGNYP